MFWDSEWSRKLCFQDPITFQTYYNYSQLKVSENIISKLMNFWITGTLPKGHTPRPWRSRRRRPGGGPRTSPCVPSGPPRGGASAPVAGTGCLVVGPLPGKRGRGTCHWSSHPHGGGGGSCHLQRFSSKKLLRFRHVCFFIVSSNYCLKI